MIVSDAIGKKFLDKKLVLFLTLIPSNCCRRVETIKYQSFILFPLSIPVIFWQAVQAVQNIQYNDTEKPSLNKDTSVSRVFTIKHKDNFWRSPPPNARYDAGRLLLSVRPSHAFCLRVSPALTLQEKESPARHLRKWRTFLRTAKFVCKFRKQRSAIAAWIIWVAKPEMWKTSAYTGKNTSEKCTHNIMTSRPSLFFPSSFFLDLLDRLHWQRPILVQTPTGKKWGEHLKRSF